MLPGETILSGAPKTSNVSDFKVMKSNAGWYIGTTIHEEGCDFPYTRETTYFPSLKQAEEALLLYRNTGLLRGQR